MFEEGYATIAMFGIWELLGAYSFCSDFGLVLALGDQ